MENRALSPCSQPRQPAPDRSRQPRSRASSACAGVLGGDHVVHNQALDGVSLGQAGGDQNHALGGHDVAHAHGDGGGGNVLLLLEETGVGVDGALGQLLDVSNADQMVAGLVEGDVTVVADAQQLQVGNAALTNLGFQLGSVGFRVTHALGNVGVGLVDVDVIEQVGVHEVAVALVVGLGDAAVLIQIHGVYLREVHLAGFVGLDQLLVHGYGGAAGGQAQLAVGLLVHQFADHIGHIGAAFIVAFGNNNFHCDTLRSLYFSVKLAKRGRTLPANRGLIFIIQPSGGNL